ncbi:hypothetical protein FEDK69T_15770 [Flavobacterium enshiense DK69]|uniref:DUF4595 domain-containing protein n=1 Tax=Flavobacterium enshiense DK69 TaxID=1107311 RepID=V6S9S8_9FLAO|nr:hypothetical protein [Flavobacterium enshiense]ESU23411.1 hypothetical protein FEDK69T_15770 [Flavobacterium enshiense DK69]KGO96363.1 hypothetical protein Q767_05465 [Flavobacterium enshiense DK69]
MKRLSIVLGVAAIALLASCSNDEFVDTIDDSSSEIDGKLNPNAVLVKRIVATSNNGGSVTTDDYVYNGSKLSKVVSTDGRQVSYIYTGNLITERDYFNNNVLNSKELYEYNANNQLTTYKRINSSNTVTYKAVFSYNSDGTVTVNGYRGDVVSQSNMKVNRKIFFSNGKVSRMETYRTVNGSPVTEAHDFSYDTKNSPFKGILGFDKLTYHDIALNGNVNNVTSIAVSGVSAANSVSDQIQYTYNSGNYPVSANRGSVTFQYYY